MLKSRKQSAQLPQRMLTVSEVAELVHVHPNTVRQWSNCGLLRCYRVGYRRDRRFKPEDLNAFLTSDVQSES